MSLQPLKITAIARDDSGGNNIIPNAPFSVVNGSGGFPQLWEEREGLTPVSNPGTCDANGERQVWVEGGYYSISVGGGQSWEVDLVSAVAELENYAAVRALNGSNFAQVSVAGRDSDGDGGGGIFAKISSGSDDDATILVDAGGQPWGRVYSGPIYGEWWGIDPDDASNQTSKISAAISAALSLEKKLMLPAGTYQFDGFSHTSGQYSIDIDCHNGIAELIGTASVGASGRVLRFTTTGNVGTYTLGSGISTDENFVVLVSASGIQPGMMIRITSNVLWPYDNRGVYYKGETHLVESVVGNTVYFTDQCRDNYSVAQIDNITVWNPNRLSIRNLKISATANGSACIQFNRCLNPIVENVETIDGDTAGLWVLECWNARLKNITCNGTKLNTTGYGVQDRGGVGTLIDGLFSKGMRRSFDAESQSGTASSPCRDYHVTNFSSKGGDKYWPFTAEENYGIGNHGPSENGRFSNGTIRDCQIGVNLRGAKMTLNNIDIYGSCQVPVDLTYGTGVNIENVNYYPDGFPNKGVGYSSMNTAFLPDSFIRFGRASTTDADWDFISPVKVVGCSAAGLKDAVYYFENVTQNIRNILTSGNKWRAATNAGLGDFYFIRHLSNVQNCVFSDHKDTEYGNRAFVFCNGQVGTYNGASRKYSVLVDGTYIARIEDDDYIEIGDIAKYTGSRPIIFLSLDANGRQMFEIRPLSATITNAGAIAMANLAATATPLSLNGTFGVDGNVTVGMTAEGIMYLENRSGAATNIRVSVVC